MGGKFLFCHGKVLLVIVCKFVFKSIFQFFTYKSTFSGLSKPKEWLGGSNDAGNVCSENDPAHVRGAHGHNVQCRRLLSSRISGSSLQSGLRKPCNLHGAGGEDRLGDEDGLR